MTVIIAVLFIFIIIWSAVSTAKGKKKRAEIIERRNQYAKKFGPNTRVIVNDGVHFFFKNDDKQVFGIDDSGNTYCFSGLLSVQKRRDGVVFMHTSSPMLCVGKDYGNQATLPLDALSINLICSEMMPVLRINLQKELDKYGVTPTHEYEHDGEIWGCDIDSKQFYCVYGTISVFKFSDLRRVTVDDLRNNSLYNGSYIIHVFVKDENSYNDLEFDIHIHTPDETYYNLLAMFKGIRNRQ